MLKLSINFPVGAIDFNNSEWNCKLATHFRLYTQSRYNTHFFQPKLDYWGGGAYKCYTVVSSRDSGYRGSNTANIVCNSRCTRKHTVKSYSAKMPPSLLNSHVFELLSILFQHQKSSRQCIRHCVISHQLTCRVINVCLIISSEACTCLVDLTV